MKSRFQDSDAFLAAVELMVEVYRLTESFPREERYGLTVQIRKASVSVVSHIAEGQGRLTYGEWRQMLSQARGSLFEVEAQSIAANRLHFLADEPYALLRERVADAARPLQGLIDYVQRREREEKAKKR